MSWLRGGVKEPKHSSNIIPNDTEIEKNNMVYSVRDSMATASNYANLLFKQRSTNDNMATGCDPKACYDSFCKHWHQVSDIISKFDKSRKREQHQSQSAMHDDVLAVVSHLDFMITLLLVDLQNWKQSGKNEQNRSKKCEINALTPCLRYLLSENLLEKLFNWSCSTGRYTDALYLEHCKLYELLLSQTRYQLLYYQQFVKPLVNLLVVAANEQRNRYPLNLEKQLVLLLNHLCVALRQDAELLDKFFVPTTNNNDNSFVIYDVLISYVHRDGSLGQQARETLLLCMLFSQKNTRLATFIAEQSSMCALLVTGLGGLFSRLPKFVEINSIECHRIMPDDVNTMPDLILFMNALEFCNAIAQTAHDLIKIQMMDFMYQGFIIPVLVPTILQENANDQISTMLYIELIFRSVSEPGLLKLFIKCLLDANKCDGIRILDVLTARLNSTEPSVCVAAMVLFDTLLSLHCEDLLLELLLKYLIPGKHVPLSYRYKINKIDLYSEAVTFFLNLAPDIMKQPPFGVDNGEDIQDFQGQQLKNGGSSSIIGTDSVYGNYRAYLFEAHLCIAQCVQACKSWCNFYNLYKWPPKRVNNNLQQQRFTDMVKHFHEEIDCQMSNNDQHQQQAGNTGNDYTACSTNLLYDDKKQLDSLQSLGESSGYESFRWRAPNEDDDVISHDLYLGAVEKSPTQVKDFWRHSKQHTKSDWTESDFSQESFCEETAFLGPFFNAIWNKLQTFTSNNLYVNLHLTGLITRLAWYPFTILHSVLLRPDIIITSQMPSFHQILAILKQQIDAELPINCESLEVVNKARLFLINRENYLLQIRKGVENINISSNINSNNNIINVEKSSTLLSDMSNRGNHSKTFSSLYDSFRRRNSKSKNFGQSIVNIFSRKSSGTTIPKSSMQKVAGDSRQRSSASSVNQRKLSFRETSLTGTEIASDQNFRSLPSNISLDAREVTRNILHDRHNIQSNSKVVKKYLTVNAHEDNNGQCQNDNSDDKSMNKNNSLKPADSLIIERKNTSIGTGESSRIKDLALCAILLDEWLKELAAISQEQSIVMIQTSKMH